MNANHYKFWARVVAITHAVIAVYVCIGNQVLAMIFPSYRFPALFVLPAIALGWWILNNKCGLTELEQRLLSKYDPDYSYNETFIYHYVGKPLGIHLPPFFVFVFAALGEAFLIWLYLRNFYI